MNHTPEFTQPQFPSDEIPYGYCHCGCGQKTTIAPFDDIGHGYLKGQPRRYIDGHHRRIRGDGPNPSGLCMCGCGQQTKIAPQTQRSKGWIGGQPVRFVAGHNISTYRETLADAFWTYCTPGNPNECWIWQGTTYKGYGYFKWNNTKYIAHRVAYQLHYGEILVSENPHDNCVCHTCDHPPCCNWAHLFLGTQADNNADRDKKGRQVIARGEAVSTSKLTERDIIDIRRRVSDGEPQVNLARHYGVTKTSIGCIVHRKSWKHLE